jgi:RNA polymerase sigma-B factor
MKTCSPMTNVTDIPVRQPVRRAAGYHDRPDRELFTRLKRDGDERARSELVVRFIGLARSVGCRYRHPSEPDDDLCQVAAVGLVKAIDRYDPDRGVGFAAFAIPTMLGEVRRHLRDRSWAVRPPRDLQELSLRVEHATDRLTSDLGRHATVEDLAEHLAVSDRDVLEALQAGAARRPVSLSAPCHEAGGHFVLGDVLSEEERGFARAERDATIVRLLAYLTPRERAVLTLRYRCDLTQAQIGEIVGVSQTQVSRIVHRAVEKLALAVE